MSVYVDTLRVVIPTKRWPWHNSCHMVADTVEELHAMAARIGCRREWFQTRSFPHYDLTVSKRTKALFRGAVEVNGRELVDVIRRFRASQNREEP